MNMATDDKARAKGADIESWWMDEVRQIVEDRKADQDESLVELGKALAGAVGRPEAWSHSSVSRFLGEKNLTTDLAEAFAVLFEIPLPIYVARSRAEALAMQQVARRYDDKKVTPDQKRRIGHFDQASDAAENETRGQSGRVGSHDEVRAARGGRGRGVDRGRS